jgi:cellulose synthase/poly-beta-1,6-N-acetylglucosamine synthase-like glycosyltransferase
VGRSRLAGFGLFGGSNGYWRTQVLHAVRMNPTMLTEDIDSSVRAVLAGATIAYDRGLLSTELAPTTWTQLVGQRGRWSQGWAQVSKRWLPSLLRSPYLDRKQKVASVFLFGWREIHPWLAWQMFALLTWQIISGNTGHWHPLPMWLLTTVLTLGVSAFQAYLGYTLGWRGVSTKRRRLFFRYAFANTFFYAEFRSTLTRIAHVREFLGERTWRITRRASGGAA